MNCPECSSPLEFRAPRCAACGSSVHLTSVTTVSGHLPIFEDRSLHFPPGALLAERFTVLEKAGDGGMGIVYKAFDTALDQEVALKLIRADLAGDEAFVDRFKQEVRLTRQISHPNVCRVHDLGESHGLLFLSMEWLEGQTLTQLLKNGEPLESKRALEIAGGIAQALAAAHARGIVHRDLKPSNVMIDKDGAVHVMDFGIAVGPGSAAEPPSGTPAYMSPEQWRGERPDARSDLFALGLILLEMLGYQPSEPDQRFVPRLPQPLQRRVGPLLQSLLAEDKEERCPSAEEAVARIHRIREGSAGSGWRSRARHALAGPRRWILAGATLALISTLGYLALSPRPQNPSSADANRSSPGWAYYVRGLQYLQDWETVRSLDDAIHMLHRATEADPRLVLAWARLEEAYWLRYEATYGPSSREEALLAKSKAEQLNPRMPEVRYASARGLIAEKKYREGKSALEEVVKQDANLDAAWAALAVADRETNDYAGGLRAIQTAIKLNPRYFRHQTYLALFLYRFGEFDRAIQACRKALELKPTSITAWDMLGATYLKLGRYQDASAALVQSLKIEEKASGFSNLGTVYYGQGKFDRAVDSYRRATELEPLNADHWGNLGDALQMLKRDDEAHGAYLRAAEEARLEAERVPADPRAHLMLGLYCARARDKVCAIREGHRAAAMQPESSEILFRNAVIHCIFGEDDEALNWLEKGVKLGLTKSEVQGDPDLIRLHGLPRYQKILELAS